MFILDLKDFSGNLETVSEAYEDIYESSEDEGEIVFDPSCTKGPLNYSGISMRRVLDDKCEVVINSEVPERSRAAR